MKKPVEAIERMRKREDSREDCMAIVAYLDSQEWPADLTYERMMELAYKADCMNSHKAAEALRRLAELAPKRGKRKITLWSLERTLGGGTVQMWTDNGKPPAPENQLWVKVREFDT